MSFYEMSPFSQHLIYSERSFSTAECWIFDSDTVLEKYTIDFPDCESVAAIANSEPSASTLNGVFSSIEVTTELAISCFNC